MTLQELSQYYKLRERLNRDEEILDSLRAAACPGAQNLSGMPHAPGVRDKVGDLAVEIADMTERIRYLKEEIDRAEAAVRFSLSPLTTEAEIDQAVAAAGKCYAALKAFRRR